jgi:putative oxidoreductase
MKHPKLTYAAQLLAAVIYLYSVYLKFSGDAHNIQIFETLGMEPGGRFIIGFLELLAALFLLSPLAAFGSVLSVGIMCGAILAHLTQIGIVVNDDGGMMFGLMIIELLCSSYVMYSRRGEIPFVGTTFRSS